MTIVKKITASVSAVLVTVLIALFCLLFTAPGNQFIAYSANKLVDGLNIEIKNGRFLYNDAFNLRYNANGLVFNAQQLKINLFWWQCDGLCIENVSAKSIALTLPQAAEQAAEAPSEALDKISLPFNIAIKNVAVNEFTLQHASADVMVNNFQLAAKAVGSELVVKRLDIANAEVSLKEPAQSQQPAAPAITQLPALPNIEFSTPLDLSIEQFLITQLTLNQAEQQHTIANIALQMRLTDSTLKVDTLTASYQQWQLNTQLNAEIAGNMPLTAKIELASSAHQAMLSASGNLADLTLDVETRGQFPLTLTANANLKQRNYPFTLNGNIKQWIIDAEADQLKLRDVNLTAEGHADDYQLSLTANSQLGAYPAVDLKTQLTGSLTQAQLTTLHINAHDSTANVSAKVDWQQGLKADFTGTLAHLKAQYVTDSVTSDVSGQFKGEFTAKSDQWQLQMTDTMLTGTLNKVPLKMAANFRLDNTFKATIDSLYLSSGVNKLALSGEVDKHWQLDGKLTLNSDEKANMPFIANGKANLKVRGERLTPSLDLALMLERFIYDEIEINKLAIKGTVNTATDWQTDISVNVGSALVAEQQINNITLDATGDKTDHRVSAAVDAERGAVELEINGHMSNAVWQGEITHVLLSDKTLRFNNSKKVALKVNTQTGDFDVAKHCWHSEQSELCIDTLSQSKQLGQLNAKLNNLALTELSHLLPESMGAEGALSGEFVANWHAGALKTLRASLSSNNLIAKYSAEEDSYRLPIEALTMRAFSDSQVGELTASLDSSVLGNITTQINVEDIQQSQQLSGNVTIDKILFANIQPFLETFEQLNGEIRGKLRLAGTLKEPQLEGEINVDDINLQGEQLPIALEKSHINILFNKATATIKGNLHDPQGGKININGDVDWQGEQPAVNVAIVGEQFYVRAQQGVVFKVSPNLTLGLANSAFKLVGEVVVPYGRIEIEELPEGAVQVSDDEIIVDQKTTATKKVPFDYDIDLKLLVKDDVKVASFGLESNVIGDLAIKMSQGEPIIATGELKLINGTYLAFGQDLIIRTGKIGFSGSIEQPYLNIKAIRNPQNTANGVIAGVTLTGTIEQPRLKIFSEPAMDQAQALAYLLNGQPLGEGDSSTDAMLTQLLLSQGVSRSEGFVSKVGETFGLSDVSFTSKGSGEQTKVEISGYVAPSLQVRYSVGIFDSLSEVAMRYQLLSQLYIEVTSGLNQSVDILYKFDWD
jgi:translocation and assembly module TamB